MNLWDLIFSIIGAAAKQTQKIEADLVQEREKREKNIQRYEQRYKDLDRNDLIRRYQNSTGDSKIAAGRLLKKQSSQRDQ